MSQELNINDWPRYLGSPSTQGVLRSSPDDFQVDEELGFEPDGEGEHAFLLIEKCSTNTQFLARRLARLAAVPPRDVGFSGLKDRHARTRQWFSVGLAGKAEPDWAQLNDDVTTIKQVTRHRRKLRRGVHRANRFSLTLRRLQGDREALQRKLERIGESGVPNYFGEQRFGRNAGNLTATVAWMRGETRAPKRERRSMYLSALRSYVFNSLLAQRVAAGNWQQPVGGEPCRLRGSRSFFVAEEVDEALLQRARSGDVHPALPLWGKGRWDGDREGIDASLDGLKEYCEFLEQQGLKLDWRPTRMMPDDFSWQFCDDDAMTVSFELEAGSFATALLRELVDYTDNNGEWDSQ